MLGLYVTLQRTAIDSTCIELNLNINQKYFDIFVQTDCVLTSISKFDVEYVVSSISDVYLH